MKITKSKGQILLELEEEEDVAVEYIRERGAGILEEELYHWIRGRIATVREEVRMKIASKVLEGKSLKEMIEEVKNG